MSTRGHWDTIYSTKGAKDVSWFRPHLERSLAFLEAAGIGREAAIIDIGGGASTFVDDLLDRGYENVTVLDLSQSALDVAQARLGDRAGRVRWICADVTEASLSPAAFDFWHDRAVFHFLRDALARERYVAAVRRSLKPGGHIVVATFGPHGPEKRSGLEVMRYSPEELHAEFGPAFARLDSAKETHVNAMGQGAGVHLLLLPDARVKPDGRASSIVELADLPDRLIRPLLDASEAEGFRFVRRVVTEWASGKNRFSGSGEALLGTLVDDRLVAICGLMRDPYLEDPGVGRLRNLYVLPAYRRLGLGAALTLHVIGRANPSFRLLRLRAATRQAGNLYEQLGFTPTADVPDCTHILSLEAMRRQTP